MTNVTKLVNFWQNVTNGAMMKPDKTLQMCQNIANVTECDKSDYLWQMKCYKRDMYDKYDSVICVTI